MSKKIIKKQSAQNIIVNNIDIRQLNRANVEIQSWRDAIRAAESVYFPRRWRLYEMYEEIMLDAHLTSVIEKRKDAIKNLPITFTENGKDNERMNELIKAPWFTDLLSDILDAKFYGTSIMEFQEFNADEIKYEVIDRRYYVPEKGIILKNPGDMQGFEYRKDPYDPWILEVGKKKDLGLLLKAVPYVIYKRNGLADLAQYGELFGQPIRKGKYDPLDTESRFKLKTALDEAGSSFVIIIPEGTDVELIYPSNTSGSADLFERITSINDAQLSKLVMHETLTTEQGDKGARSLGEIHMEVAESVHMSDRKFTLDVLNYDLRWLLHHHGYPCGSGLFGFNIARKTDLEKKIIIDRNLKEMGLPIDDDYLYETYGVRKPDNYIQMKAEITERKNTELEIMRRPDSNLSKINNLFRFFGKAPRR